MKHIIKIFICMALIVAFICSNSSVYCYIGDDDDYEKKQWSMYLKLKMVKL